VTPAPTLLFDLDGTLVDPVEGITRSIQYALAKLDRPVPETDELLWCIGPPLTESFKQLLGTPSPELGARALYHYRQRYNETGKFENRVYPRIPRTLEALRQAGARLLMATAKPTVFAVQIAAHFGLEAHFDAVYGSELNGERAEKTDLIAHVLATERLAPSTTTMVGDRKHDILGAKANGIKAVGVAYGYGGRAELTEAGADMIVERPEELPRILEPAGR
jgi:phosphoglycolate phosphatase